MVFGTFQICRLANSVVCLLIKSDVSLMKFMNSTKKSLNFVAIILDTIATAIQRKFSELFLNYVGQIGHTFNCSWTTVARFELSCNDWQWHFVFNNLVMTIHEDRLFVIAATWLVSLVQYLYHRMSNIQINYLCLWFVILNYKMHMPF